MIILLICKYIEKFSSRQIMSVFTCYQPENFIYNTVLHENCKNLELYFYDKDPSILPKGTNVVNIGYRANHPNFNYQVLKNENTVFIVMKGTKTTSVKDWEIDKYLPQKRTEQKFQGIIELIRGGKYFNLFEYFL